MIGMIVRSVVVLGVVFQYSLSVWQAIDKYFAGQFRKYHLHNSTNDTITNISDTQSITFLNISDGVCLRKTITELIKCYYCPVEAEQ